MASVNKVILVGNLGADPEVKYVMENVPVATFRIATTESYKDKSGEWKDATEWHNIVAWRNLAERVEKYFKKGTQIYVEGKLRNRSYDDKDGNKRYITEIVAEQLFTTGKREGTDSGGMSNTPAGSYDKYVGTPNNGASNASSPTNVPIDDDLPF